jgi:hypothetical protein
MTQEEAQKAHEQAIAELLDKRTGAPESDWALVRALIHKAVHLAADRKAGEFCAVAILLAEMTQHAHQLMHPAGQSSPQQHDSYMH